VKAAQFRRGVTLLITLSIIAAMLGLVGLLFGYIDQARAKAEFRRALIQADLLRTDIGAVLRRTLGKKPSVKTLELAYTLPIYLATRNAPFSVSVQCKPLLNRLRIAWLEAKEGQSPDAQKYAIALRIFERLSDQAELKNPSYLLKLIQEALHKRHQRFSIGGKLQKKEGIITQSEFLRLLDDYRFKEDDPRVYRIAWGRYFTFADSAVYPYMDGEFAPANLLALILDLDSSVVREGLEPGSFQDFLTTVGIDPKEYDWLFAKGSVPAMECRTSFHFQEGDQQFRFQYIGQRIVDFEIASK